MRDAAQAFPWPISEAHRALFPKNLSQSLEAQVLQEWFEKEYFNIVASVVGVLSAVCFAIVILFRFFVFVKSTPKFISKTGQKNAQFEDFDFPKSAPPGRRPITNASEGPIDMCYGLCLSADTL